MQHLIKEIEAKHKKSQVVDVRSGDIVRVHQKIKEGAKTRIQVFEGLVIRTDRKNSLSSRITVRRIASGVGVEKSFLLHSPLVQKTEVIKRSSVKRNYLSYMRTRFGKSARLAGIDFDKEGVNTISIEKQIEQNLGSNEEIADEEKIKIDKSEINLDSKAEIDQEEDKTSEVTESTEDKLPDAEVKK